MLYWQSEPLAADLEDAPVFLGYQHPPVGTTARNTIHATSRLLLPVLTAEG